MIYNALTSNLLEHCAITTLGHLIASNSEHPTYCNGTVWVLSPSLFFPWIPFVLSVQFVLQVRLLLDRSWLALSAWCQPRHASRDKSVQAFPRFSYCKRQKLGVEAWERGYSSCYSTSALGWLPNLNCVDNVIHCRSEVTGHKPNYQWGLTYFRGSWTLYQI